MCWGWDADIRFRYQGVGDRMRGNGFNWKKVGLDSVLGRNSSWHEWWGTGSGCPQKWRLHSWLEGALSKLNVEEGVPVHGTGLGTRVSLRTLTTQSIPSFHASVIRYEMYNRLRCSLPSSPKSYGSPMEPTHSETRPAAPVEAVTGNVGGPVLSCILPSCCFRFYRACFILVRPGRLPWFSQETKFGPFFLNTKVIPLKKQNPTLQFFNTII